MKIGRRKSEVPGLNTTSTADISFMLLVFFLVTTSMYEAKGLMRHLPPKDKEKDKKEIIIDKENFFALKISASGELSVNDSVVRMEDLKSHMEKFILWRGKTHLFTIDASPDCKYETYFLFQQHLGEAYSEARQAIAKKMFGHSLDELTSTDREKVFMECPQRVAENFHENELPNSKEEGGAK